MSQVFSVTLPREPSLSRYIASPLHQIGPTRGATGSFRRPLRQRGPRVPVGTAARGTASTTGPLAALSQSPCSDGNRPPVRSTRGGVNAAAGRLTGPGSMGGDRPPAAQLDAPAD